jgi:hypothetical protein
LSLKLITEAPIEELLTVGEVAKKLGYRSSKTVLNLNNRGHLGHVDLTPEGNVRRTGLRVPASELAGYIARRHHAPRISA